MNRSREVMEVDMSLMKLVQQIFTVSADLIDDWEAFFPAMHLIWERHSDEIFPYELCENIDNLKSIIVALEGLANEVKEKKTVVYGIEGEA